MQIGSYTNSSGKSGANNSPSSSISAISSGPVSSYWLGFEWQGTYFAIPSSEISGVCFSASAQPDSKILKLSEVIVSEGQPVYLKEAIKLIPQLAKWQAQSLPNQGVEDGKDGGNPQAKQIEQEVSSASAGRIKATQLNKSTKPTKLTKLTKPTEPEQAPWVVILKDRKNISGAAKGCGFRVKNIMPPFLVNYEVGMTVVRHAEQDYHCLPI